MTAGSVVTRSPGMAARLLYSAWRTVVTRGSGSDAGVRVGRNREFQNGGL